jgi:hypothetical protein
MRISDLPAGKKRYSLSLTRENVNRFHAILLQIGADKGYMSRCVDEFIGETADVLEDLLEKGNVEGKKLGLKDVFWVLGKKMDEMVQDEKEFVLGKEKNAKSTPETEKVESRKG